MWRRRVCVKRKQHLCGASRGRAEPEKKGFTSASKQEAQQVIISDTGLSARRTAPRHPWRGPSPRPLCDAPPPPNLFMITATTSDNSEEMITFIIFNRTGIGAKATFSATLSADATLQALHEKVAEECEIVPGTFELRRAIDGFPYRLTDTGSDTRHLGGTDGIIHKMKLNLEGVDGGTPVASGGIASSCEDLCLWGFAGQLAARVFAAYAHPAAVRGIDTACLVPDLRPRVSRTTSHSRVGVQRH